MNEEPNAISSPASTIGAAESTRADAGRFAFAYQIVPPQTKRWQRDVQHLLDAEHEKARAAGHIWSARLMFEPQVTRILVVSDDPDPRHPVNLKLEASLRDLQCEVSRSAPVSVLPDDDDAVTP